MGANNANGHAPNWAVAWVKRIPGIPILGNLAPVNLGDRVVNQPDRLRYSDFDMGATTHVIMFPGDPDMVGAWNPNFPRPPARNKTLQQGVMAVPPPTIPQTVSNLRRAQLAGMDAVPVARLDIFEGVSG